MADRRTTPPWLRVPALVLLLVQAMWFGSGWRFALNEARPEIFQEHPWALWFATWEMFTLRDRGATLIEAEARYGEGWQPVDLEGLFPTRWESGPRYARPAFYLSEPHMAVLGEATCGRLDTRPSAVRFTAVRFRKRPGVPSTTPPANAKREVLRTWTCGDPIPVPPGRRL